jgi:tripartite-type tricarboxylate transporter receptor subunit TctC
MARAIATRLERRIGRRVTVQNKRTHPDAVAGKLFREDVERGLVVAFMPSTTLMPQAVNAPFPFDAASTLVPLTTAGALQLAFAVSPGTGVSRLADYAAWVDAKPEERQRLGTTATDAYLTVYGRMIGHALGLSEQIVPQRGAARLVHALVESRLPAGIGSVTPLLAHNYGGEVRILMTSGRRRPVVLREVPTAAEIGHPELELDEWYGFFASSASPSPVVAEWNRQLQATLGDREVVAALEQFGVTAETSTPAETQARIAAHSAAWERRMATFGAKAPG